MDVYSPRFLAAVLEIILINILLSGDNAVVIALACRTLPPRQRFWGMVIGAGAASVLRIVFTGLVSTRMMLPCLKLVAAGALLWIAGSLLAPNETADARVKTASDLWRAVRIV